MTAINQWCAKAQKFLKSVCDRLSLGYSDCLHLLVSFLLAWALRGCVLKSWWVWLPLIVVFVLKELYDKYKPNSTGFSWKDLALDLTGGTMGFILAALCCAVIK
ncbi:MAG: hypothetical protein J6T94_05550 [Bacteroidaceae bacterium]|nr:hypothetical protein [Bacteroidaceae bacterium]